MEIKYLAKSIRFATLPTISVLMLLFFGFFSISKTVAFITSDQWFAVILRVGLVIAETALIVRMYQYYRDEDIYKNTKSYIKDIEPTSVRATSFLYDLKHNWNDKDKYSLYITDDSDVVIIQREAKSSS